MGHWFWLSGKKVRNAFWQQNDGLEVVNEKALISLLGMAESE